MGTDDLFKKNRVEREDLKKKDPSRTAGKRFLIVCEGSKTEPYYFQEFCKVHKLSTLRVGITPSERGSSPDCVVTYAEQLFDEEAQKLDRYDQVFCVFDRDQHSTFEAATQRIEDLSATKPFVAIPSYPCFEYWLLLHFTYTRQPFDQTSKISVCESVIRKLRKQTGFEHYEKAQKEIYSQLRDRTDIAIKHAQQAENEAGQTGEENPSTRVHHLVIELRNLVATHGRKR